jgi:transposase
LAKYRDYSYEQTRMLPVSLQHQIQPGTIEHTINYLIDNEIDLTVFDEQYKNDETGAPAIDPAILLKIILFAYSRGIVSSRQIARACEENMVFMALAADTRPHFTTIADFISSMGNKIVSLFRDILAVCYTEGLIGKHMFAVDGCKIAGNCAKEWSGTKEELMRKAAKIEQGVKVLIRRHRQEDRGKKDPDQAEKEKRAVKNLKKKAKKIRDWLEENEERTGAQGKPVKSNITDNESAKMPSSHGVIQGYNGIAAVDDKCQVVVDAQAFGEGHEARSLEKVVEAVEETFADIEGKRKIFQEVVLTADSGFNSEQSMRKLLDRGVEAYVADRYFRQRDPRFARQKEYKQKTIDRKRTSKAPKYLPASAFELDSSGVLVCPAGKPMTSSCPNWRDKKKGYTGRTFKGFEKYCSVCELRKKCLRSPASKVRQVTKIDPGIRLNTKSAVQEMAERFDTARGRFFYSRRMGTVEPVFANIRHTLGLDHFTLRGREKVDTQWKLFCLVNNIGKLARYATI